MSTNLVLAPYFTRASSYSQHDSSNGGKGGCRADDYELMKPWYESVLRLGLHARIFHNELSLKFINDYETDNVKFIYWPGTNRPSYNDERFYAYYSYLSQKGGVNQVFLTDLFDVEFLMNPFDLMSEKEVETEQWHIFSGSERINTYNRDWLKSKCKMMSYPTARDNYQIGRVLFNAGIIGGKVKWVMKLLDDMIGEMNRINQSHNSNMPVYNFCVERRIVERHWKVFCGYPLHNVFNSFTADNGTYIRHK